jgi:hypothetical protein
MKGDRKYTAAARRFYKAHPPDKALVELRNLYALEDTRDGNKCWWAWPYYKGLPRDYDRAVIVTRFLA